jgi:hypothetical protein
MNETLFWKILSLLDWNKAGDDDAVLRPALDALAALSEADISEFADLLAEKLYALDTREVARAVYAGQADPDNGNDYISADDFLYSRCVGVANGRAFFEKVLADPRNIPPDMEFEALLDLPAQAYEQKTGKTFDRKPRVSFESFSNAEGWKPTARTRPGKFTGPDVPPSNRRPS